MHREHRTAVASTVEFQMPISKLSALALLTIQSSLKSRLLRVTGKKKSIIMYFYMGNVKSTNLTI